MPDIDPDEEYVSRVETRPLAGAPSIVVPRGLLEPLPPAPTPVTSVQSEIVEAAREWKTRGGGYSSKLEAAVEAYEASLRPPDPVVVLIEALLADKNVMACHGDLIEAAKKGHKSC